MRQKMFPRKDQDACAKDRSSLPTLPNKQKMGIHRIFSSLRKHTYRCEVQGHFLPVLGKKHFFEQQGSMSRSKSISKEIMKKRTFSFAKFWQLSSGGNVFSELSLFLLLALVTFFSKTSPLFPAFLSHELSMKTSMKNLPFHEYHPFQFL